jgi:hypothetical protein
MINTYNAALDRKCVVLFSQEQITERMPFPDENHQDVLSAWEEHSLFFLWHHFYLLPSNLTSHFTEHSARSSISTYYKT